MLGLRIRQTGRHRAAANLVIAVTAVATLISAAPSALAADPTTPIDLRDGDTHLVGTLHWHQRSLGGDYSLTTRSCTRLLLSAYDATGAEHGPASSSLICTNTSGSLNVGVNAPGGPVSSLICLADTSRVCGRYNRP
jgi:hypothetical protein